MGYRDFIRVIQLARAGHGKGVDHGKSSKVESEGVIMGYIWCLGKDMWFDCLVEFLDEDIDQFPTLQKGGGVRVRLIEQLAGFEIDGIVVMMGGMRGFHGVVVIGLSYWVC